MMWLLHNIDVVALIVNIYSMWAFINTIKVTKLVSPTVKVLILSFWDI